MSFVCVCGCVCVTRLAEPLRAHPEKAEARKTGMSLIGAVDGKRQRTDAGGNFSNSQDKGRGKGEKRKTLKVKARIRGKEKERVTENMGKPKEKEKTKENCTKA